VAGAQAEARSKYKQRHAPGSADSGGADAPAMFMARPRTRPVEAREERRFASGMRASSDACKRVRRAGGALRGHHCVACAAACRLGRQGLCRHRLRNHCMQMGGAAARGCAQLPRCRVPALQSCSLRAARAAGRALQGWPSAARSCAPTDAGWRGVSRASAERQPSVSRAFSRASAEH
jgi:hypothetical protein